MLKVSHFCLSDFCLHVCSHLWSDSLAVAARCCHRSLMCDSEAVRWTQITLPTLFLLSDTATGYMAFFQILLSNKQQDLWLPRLEELFWKLMSKRRNLKPKSVKRVCFWCSVSTLRVWSVEIFTRYEDFKWKRLPRTFDSSAVRRRGSRGFQGYLERHGWHFEGAAFTSQTAGNDIYGQSSTDTWALMCAPPLCASVCVCILPLKFLSFHIFSHSAHHLFPIHITQQKKAPEADIGLVGQS